MMGSVDARSCGQFPSDDPRQFLTRGILAIALCVTLGACATAPAARSPMSTVSQTGVASWYGPGFDGKPTASGETYDQNALTAAHRTLPLGTRIRVTNLDNDRAVSVRINDRGPFVGDRILDLSYGAARELEMIAPGTARVRIDVIESPSPITAVPATLTYVLQLGSFTSRPNAEALRDRAANVFGDAMVVVVRVNGVPHYRVQMGAYTTRDAADAAAARVRDAGFPALIVER